MSEQQYLINVNYKGEPIQVAVATMEEATLLLSDQDAVNRYLYECDPETYPCPSSPSTFDVSNVSTVTNSDLTEKLWNNQATIILISLIKKYDTELDRGVKKYVWRKISQELSSTLNKNFTETQVNTKWKGLVKTYKDIISHNNTSGKNRKYWEFYDLIHDILFKKPEINPTAICSSYGGLKLQTKDGFKKNENFKDLCSTPSTSCEDNEGRNLEPSTKTGKSNFSQYESVFSKKRKERETDVNKRHKEKMQRLDNLQNSLNELVNILKEKKE